jgi:hypothetical protein
MCGEPESSAGKLLPFWFLFWRRSGPPGSTAAPGPAEAMAHRLQTKAGKALYALRKQMPEPVFGIIKSVMGFRQFSLRGLDIPCSGQNPKILG